jgi:PIN domain
MSRIREPVLITSFVEVELCNAIQLRVFRKALNRHEAHGANRAFEQDVLGGTFALQPISPATFELAKRLSLTHTSTLGTRSLDLMHVASALILAATTFLSFDQSQRKLAHAAGLTLQPRALAPR